MSKNHRQYMIQERIHGALLVLLGYSSHGSLSPSSATKEGQLTTLTGGDSPWCYFNGLTPQELDPCGSMLASQLVMMTVARNSSQRNG